MTFAEKTLHFVQPESKVLDLGSGNGWFAREVIDLGGIVTAVDKNRPPEIPRGVTWFHQDVHEYLTQLQSSETFNLIFSRNLIQFLDREWVQKTFFPKLISHLAPSGIIAIQTFYQNPEPPFERPLKSTYTEADLQAMLGPLNILHHRQFSNDAPDMKGVPRTFFITNCIAQKK